jgi:hypothetical protein
MLGFLQNLPDKPIANRQEPLNKKQNNTVQHRASNRIPADNQEALALLRKINSSKWLNERIDKKEFQRKISRVSSE